jgi:hypothetical protein
MPASIRRILFEGARSEWNGIPLGIEHSPGDVRTGVSRDGEQWEREMHASYGYIRGTRGLGADGDAIDVYVRAEPEDVDVAYRIKQTTQAGDYDEDKLMLGYPSKSEAKADFLRHMPAWAFGGISAVPVDELRSEAGLA